MATVEQPETTEPDNNSSEKFAFSPSVIIASQPQSVAAEALRTLRGVIMTQHVQAGRRALAICSPSSGTGCTFIAANLAVAMSQAGVNTLLIDANLRSPGLSEYIRGPKSNVGLVELLRDETLPLSEGVQIVQDNLSVLHAGNVDDDGIQNLGGQAFQNLVGTCLREYDLTVIDTPAANRFSDCRRIASVTRYALVVACRERSYVSDVKQLVNELQFEKTAVIGTFLNDF